MDRHIIIAILLVALCATSCAQSNGTAPQAGAQNAPTVYFTKEISPESLLRIYQALGVEAHGRVAVKISTGEGGNENYLRPPLIRQLVEAVDGTLVECCTAYGGSRATIESHRRTIHEHGFDSIFTVDLMDEEDTLHIPVRDTAHIPYDIVGSHLRNYDFLVNLAHFKGHPMGGYGGVLKNASIGCASPNGKGLIHSGGITEKLPDAWRYTRDQDAFLESMAAAAQAVHDFFGEGNVVYINVMNNMSVDCDCVAHPEPVFLKDMGILASLDPVALDKACIDLVFGHESTSGDDAAPLIERISSRHGTHILTHAAQIGLGSLEYQLVEIE